VWTLVFQMHRGQAQRPFKSPRPFLIKKICTLLISARLPSPRSSARPPDCRPCLPGAARGRLRAAALDHRIAALLARRGTRLPLSCGCPLPPCRVALLMPPCRLAQPLPSSSRLQAPPGRCLRRTPRTDKPPFSQATEDVAMC
jgi:hypothetical protein